MTSLEEVVAFASAKLEECKIPYMIVGSFASNIYGIARATQDADLVVEINVTGIEKLGQALGEEFYFDLEGAKESLRLGVIFNAVHYASGLKIDFIVLKNRPFGHEEFRRKKLTNFAGKKYWFATAEDTILAKLEWSKMGKSERQFNDAVNIAKVQKQNLDFAYLHRWADDLKIGDLLDQLLHELENIA